MLVVAAVDDEVLFEGRPPYVEAPDGGDVAAGLADGGGEAAQRARSVVEPDPEADRVRSGRGCHGRKVAARCVTSVTGSAGAVAAVRDAADAADHAAGNRRRGSTLGAWPECSTSSRPTGSSRSSTATTPGTGLQGDHRHPLDGARPVARRHPLLPVRVRGRRARRRVPAGPGHDLQARGVRQRPRRRQGRHHRRPGHAALRGPAAGLRPVRRGAERALPHRRGRRHHPGRHGPHPPRDRPRHRGQRVARRVGRPLPRHRLGGPVGDEGRGRAPVGHAVAGRSARVHLGRRQGRRRARRAPGRRGRQAHRGRRAGDAVDAVVERYGAAAVAPDAAHTVPCDIFSPCALGAVLNPTTIPELRCDAVVGSANNQLASPADAERLRHRGVVYAPDFVANAGGVINIAEEPHGYDRARGPTTASARSTTRCCGCSTGPTPTAPPPRRPPTGWPRSASPRSAAPASSARAPTARRPDASLRTRKRRGRGSPGFAQA